MSNNSNKRAPTTATQRLKQDYLRIKKDPVPYICAEPLPSNILEWHYVVRGPEMTPYEDVVPDGEMHRGQNGIQLLNGHAPAAGPNLVGLPQANRHHGLLGGALANLFVIVGFAAFAYTVKYVLRSIAQE
ncbi:Ubiquitin-conjugating enzyme E2 J2 [Microtus ochrogaster]|uniref:Ubiquitin-conjugating enzyme E2 J2 n=1 Tax=Microtus ochrogaster TaxID=79684 RepID=A0A8J6KPZ2_MICOH|nr:Ubiquitin-conjugating enzyme E2 J2 [Microtus ochrogaster]